MAFYDVRVFNPLAKRYRDLELRTCYAINEKEKKRSYNERIIRVEHGSFTPLVFSATGGMGRECAKFYKRLGEMISDKRKMNNSIVMGWIRRKLSFCLMRSVIRCVRGTRNIYTKNDIQTSGDPSVCEYLCSI